MRHRRDFLRVLALTGASSALNPLIGRRVLAAPPLFEEIPPDVSGIKWVHESAMSENRYLPETMGPGVAFFDFDNDGWMDIFMVNSGPCDFYQPQTPLKNALYKNNRDGTFTDVTDKSGVVGGREFGMGCAIADYDNDGYPDILVTAYGRCTLYHNNGNGTFSDVTDKAGVAAPGWTTSAVWFDYDNDGKLDLFLCSFVQFSLKNNVLCGDNKLGKRFYCIPRVFKPTPSLLFHNNGDGTFSEASAGTDIQRALGKGLGVVATDINNDRLMDLFVANDTVQNFLFINRGSGKWNEIGLASEIGFSANGTPRSGMGVDSADLGHRLQPRRDRRDDHMVGRRGQAHALQDKRRQLSLIARYARGARDRHGEQSGLDRDQMAAAEQPCRALDGSSDRPIRHDRRRSGAHQRVMTLTRQARDRGGRKSRAG